MIVIALFGIWYDLTNEFSYESTIDMLVSWLGYLIEILSLIVLYGYIWKKLYLKKVFWAILLFSHVIFFIGTMLYSIFYADFYNQMGLAFTVGFMVLTCLLVMPLLLANYRYVFKYDDLWKSQQGSSPNQVGRLT
jgi:hypothetical protein